jgi:diguanylate cyclase (GGDEF)-like protein/PAS domain S-box-containing protein
MTLANSQTASLQQVMEHHIQFTENAIAIFDPDNVFIFHNQAFTRMFGLEAQSMDGWSLDDWLTWTYVHRGSLNIAWESLPAWLDYVHSMSRSKPFRRFETDLVDGRWFLVSEQTYTSGHLVLHWADITQQKKTEQALKEALARIEHIAQTDELTSLPNRRHILSRIHDEFLRARRYGHAFCLGILDIDHFKRVNDTYGHPAGDEVLKHFSCFLQSHLRAQDAVGRMGGEEFAILLPETALEDAVWGLNRIRESLQREHVHYQGQNFSYTFSAGLVSMTADPQEDGDLLILKADKALYRAKNGGRNHVAYYQEPR